MSSDSADATAAGEVAHRSGFGRQEAVQTTARSLPEGARHGAAGSFVLADQYRDADAVAWPERERLPDGSLYQVARAARLAAAEEHGPELVEDPSGRERVVLSREYENADGEQVAVVMTDSRWRAGTGEGEDYRPWFKYDLTQRPVDDDGTIDWHRTRSTSLNVKIQPQVEGLVDSEGDALNLPFGEGTLVSVQSTWVDDPEELFARTARLVQKTLEYKADREDVAPDSTRIWKAEAHHRFAAEREADVVHTVRQSADLLAHHEADVETSGIHDEHRWLEVKLTSAAWQKLGFQRIGKPIQVKVYYPDSDQLEYPMNQPKIEVALQGSGSGDHLGWDQWDAIQDTIQEILLSHLAWAGVDADDLVADDYSDGAANPDREWQHPDGRRLWLQNHYQRLMPHLYREAQKENTDLVYDILDTVRRHETVTYQTLMDETGGSYRSIRRHVTRLAAMGGDDPGILAKIQDAETWVAFSSRALDEDVDDALEDCGPSSSPDDRQERAETRRERRQERRERRQGPAVAHQGADSSDRADGREDDRSDDHRTDPSPAVDDADQDDAESSTSSRWRYFGDVGLTPDQLAAALDREHVDADHVRLRVDPYDWIPPG